MICRFCNQNIEDGSTFCNKCGAKLVEEENTTSQNENAQTVPTAPAQTETIKLSKPTPNNLSKILNLICFCGFIVGLVGITLFLGIVFIGLFSYGRVYLFDGYGFTKVLSIISIIFMLIGVCSIIGKFVLYMLYKDNNFFTTILKRILLIIAVVACLGLSIWGFVDCGISAQKNNPSNDDGGGSSSSYLSFYDIFIECDCSSTWAFASIDYLSVDTNPYDYDSDSSLSTKYLTTVVSAIKRINSKLGLPSYLIQDMLETRSIDGKQTYSGSRVNVSWRYHPDSGLEVRYTRK